MPEEQFIDQQVPEPLKKVRPIPSFEEYAPEAAFGGGKEGFAEASRKTFSDIGEMQKAHEKDANESRITQLLAQAQMGMDDILKPALKRAPQDALDVKEKETSPLNLIQKKFDEVIEQSSNDDQRKFLQGALSTLKAKANESLDEYAAEQSKVLAVQSENANNKASLVSAITSPKQYDFYRNLVKTGTKYGDPNKALENFDYTFAMSRVNAGDLDTAEKILPGLSATNLKTLAKTIDGDRATQLGQKLFDEHGDKALEKASEIENPEQRKLATNEIKRQQAAKESQEKFSKDQGLIRLTEYAASHPGQDVSLLDKTTWYNLSQSQRDGINNIAMGTTKPNPEIVGEWTAIKANPERLSRLTASEFYGDILPHLAKEDMPDARALYDKTHPKDGSLGGTPKDIKVVSSKVLLNSLVGAGMIRPQSQSLGNMSTAEKKTLGNLSAHVQREVEDFQITNGKAPNAKDIQDIVDHQIKSHIAGKGWFGGTKAYFQMGINDVPSVFAKNAATKYGLSDDQVIRFYQASMDKNEAAGKAILQEGK